MGAVLGQAGRVEGLRAFGDDDDFVSKPCLGAKESPGQACRPQDRE